jgi:hypothetical protein
MPVSRLTSYTYHLLSKAWSPPLRAFFRFSPPQKKTIYLICPPLLPVLPADLPAP